jgi:hypothetical protein
MSWFSDLTGVNVDPWKGQFQVGTPQPGQAIQELPGEISRLPQNVANLYNPFGLALAAAIRNGEAQARNGAQSIPMQMFQELSGFFDPGFLQSVLFNSFESSQISLQSAMMIFNNHVGAITLNDVIVFRTNADTIAAELWSHELTHVLQYRYMGIDTFANVYTTNSWILENQAIDNRNRFVQTRNPAFAGGPFQQVAYFTVNGQCYFEDSNGVLFPADPMSGQVIGPAVARIVFQNGQYFAVDASGQYYPAIRTR